MKVRGRLKWTGFSVVLLCLMILPGCSSTGGQSGSPPPNPVISQPQSGGGGQMTTSPTAPRPQFFDFPDIPLPTELDIVPKDSYVFQAGQLKVGILTLKGRVDINSLINFFQMAMPRENWKPRGGFRYHRSILIFEKPDKSCVINLYEKTFYTYAEIVVAPAGGQI